MTVDGIGMADDIFLVSRFWPKFSSPSLSSQTIVLLFSPIFLLFLSGITCSMCKPRTLARSVFWPLCMWITSIQFLSFCLMTFNASLSSYPERYLWYATEWTNVFLILTRVRTTTAVHIRSCVTWAHGPLTYHVIIFHIYIYIYKLHSALAVPAPWKQKDTELHVPEFATLLLSPQARRPNARFFKEVTL